MHSVKARRRNSVVQDAKALVVKLPRPLRGRTLRAPRLRVLVVDDSKPFRIRLRSMLNRLFDNIEVVLCASPKEGICSVLGASAELPIHCVIVDQVFVGSKETGQEMCAVLARQSNKARSKVARTPCVLISDYADVMYNSPQSSIKTAKPHRLSRSVSAPGNIVERCHKKKITLDIVRKWVELHVGKRLGHPANGALGPPSTPHPPRRMKNIAA